jgi:hypothetical protein
MQSRCEMTRASSFPFIFCTNSFQLPPYVISIASLPY